MLIEHVARILRCSFVALDRHRVHPRVHFKAGAMGSLDDVGERVEAGS